MTTKMKIKVSSCGQAQASMQCGDVASTLEQTLSRADYDCTGHWYGQHHYRGWLFGLLQSRVLFPVIVKIGVAIIAA